MGAQDSIDKYFVDSPDSINDNAMLGYIVWKDTRERVTTKDSKQGTISRYTHIKASTGRAMATQDTSIVPCGHLGRKEGDGKVSFVEVDCRCFRRLKSAP